ncbi:AraC family transcriptional regulator [bacterium]|nr:AraC family transcriptional regulator [bacterium]
MTTFDPARKDFQPYGFSCVRWKASLMSRTDRHNEIEINLLGSGSLTYLFGGRKIQIPHQRLVVFWAAMPHQVIYFNNLENYYVMTIPLTHFLQLEFPKFFVEQVLNNQLIMDMDAREYEADEIRFAKWVDDIDSNDEEKLHICFLEVEARLRRLIYQLGPGKSEKKSKSIFLGDGDLSNVEQMARFIAQNYTKNLTVDDIAASVHLHPNYAMRLFRKTFGKTMIDYITEFRLSHAQRLLITSNELMIDIAHNAGFGSLSRFNSAFKKVFHCTPSEYRTQKYSE